MDSRAETNRPPRLVMIATHGVTAKVLMRGQLAHLRRRGFDVTLITSPGEELSETGLREEVATIGIPMEREIRPWSDFRALMQLTRTLRGLQPDIVCAGTAKGALLGLTAARRARVPIRVYLLRGLRLEQTTGTKRRLLGFCERLTARCAQRIVCVSPSLQALYVRLGFAPKEKTCVLASGSSNGVDSTRFATGEHAASQRAELRRRFGIEPEAPVIGCVGRLVRDKGIVDLLAAFDAVVTKVPTTRLLLVGEAEPGDALPNDVLDRLQTDRRITLTGWVDNPAPYYAAMDVLAFPSVREGFPNVPLEAAAAALPAVGYAATGTVDAIIDGMTGRFVPLGNVPALATALESYLADAELRARHGAAARERVERDFPPEVVWDALAGEFCTLLSARELPLPREAQPAPPNQERLAIGQ